MCASVFELRTDRTYLRVCVCLSLRLGQVARVYVCVCAYKCLSLSLGQVARGVRVCLCVELGICRERVGGCVGACVCAFLRLGQVVRTVARAFDPG